MGDTSFLDIANNIAIKCRLPSMTNCFTSSDRNAKAIKLAIMQGAKRDVFRAFDWSFLLTRKEFTTVSGTNYYAVPTDYDRSIEGTFWNNTTQRRVGGPIQIKDLTSYQNDVFGTLAMDYVCMIRGVYGSKVLQLYPTPTSTDEISYYYVSNKYIIANTHGPTLPVSAYTGDDDTTYLDDDLVEQAGLYRTLRVLGLDYSEEKFEFEKLRKERESHDGGAATLRIDTPGGQSIDFKIAANVPLIGFG